MNYNNNKLRQEQQAQSLSPEVLTKINLAKPDAHLFDKTAEDCAKQISDCKREENGSTQLRRFYDEVCIWHAKIQQKPTKEEFEKMLPLIRMLNAKVTYAQGRKLVDQKFSSLMRDCLRKVDSIETFNNFKLFFEAFLGFYKIHKPK